MKLCCDSEPNLEQEDDCDNDSRTPQNRHCSLGGVIKKRVQKRVHGYRRRGQLRPRVQTKKDLEIKRGQEED